MTKWEHVQLIELFEDLDEDGSWEWIGKLPEDGQKILVSDGRVIVHDTWVMNNGLSYYPYFDFYWMPYPKLPNKPQNIFDLIKQWGIDRNLHTADPLMQMVKLDEEVAELHNAMHQDNQKEIIDAIGDITVVLVQLATQLKLDYLECVESAYDVIKDRKGKLIDGMWVKEADLPKES